MIRGRLTWVASDANCLEALLLLIFVTKKGLLVFSGVGMVTIMAVAFFEEKLVGNTSFFCLSYICP